MGDLVGEGVGDCVGVAEGAAVVGVEVGTVVGDVDGTGVGVGTGTIEPPPEGTETVCCSFLLSFRILCWFSWILSQVEIFSSFLRFWVLEGAILTPPGIPK